MSTSTRELSATSLLREALEQARVQARDQLAAAWQLHVARVEEQLHSGWERHLDRLLEERFHELTAGALAQVESALAEGIRTEVAAALARERQAAARALAERLNQAARRLRVAEKQEDWAAALLDAVGWLTSRAAIFTVQGPALRLEKASVELEPLEVPLDSAPAFAGAVESRDPVVAEFTPSELSQAVTTALGHPTADRVHLFPVVSQGKTVAVIYAEAASAEADANSLELVASMAGAIWEARAASRSAALVAVQTARPREVQLPAWAELAPSEQELHLRAQRFARVQVAEIRLYQSQPVKQGRATRSLYRLLKEEIEKGREAYRQQFLQDCPSMVDYFHVELVRTLANDDVSLLGPDYPGPLL